MCIRDRSVEKDGYKAIQVGFKTLPESRVKKLKNKPEQGHFKKAGVAPTRYLRELRLEDAEKYEVGQQIQVDVFSEDEFVDVVGTSKGHGYSGVIQRWNAHTGPMAHGSKYHRGVGSLSANSDPSRVFKNKQMAGQWGHERVTIQHLKLVRVDAQRNLLLIKGAVPGPNGGLLIVRNSVKG